MITQILPSGVASNSIMIHLTPPFSCTLSLGAMIKKDKHFIAKSNVSVLFQPLTKCITRLRAMGYLEPVRAIA